MFNPITNRNNLPSQQQPVENTAALSSNMPMSSTTSTTTTMASSAPMTSVAGTHIGKDLGTISGLGSYATTDIADRDRNLNTMNPDTLPGATVGYAKPLGTVYGTDTVGTVNTMGLSAIEPPLGSIGYGGNTLGTTTGVGLGAAGFATATGAGFENDKGFSSDPTEHAPSKMTAYADKAMGSLKKGVGAVFSESLREKGIMQKAQGEAELEANRAAHDFKAAQKETKGMGEEFAGANVAGAANRTDASFQSTMGSNKIL